MRTAQQRAAEETAFLRERDQVLDVLHHGYLLGRVANVGATSHGTVWLLAQDAMEIASRIGDRELRWLRSADRSHMPEIVRRLGDIYEIELTRLISGMSQFEESVVRRQEPSDAELSRMFIMFSWFQFLNSGRDPLRLRKCFMALAGGASTHKIARMWRPGVKVNRQAIYDLRVRSCHWIVKGLLEEYGIVWRARGFDVT